MNLLAELQKPEYLALTDEEALAALPQTTEVLGRLQGDNKLDLLTLLATNSMEDRWLAFIEANKDSVDPQILQVVALAKILVKMLEPKLIMSELFRINLAVQEVEGMILAAQYTGLITESEYDKIIDLATYEVAGFSHVTLADIAQARLQMNPTSVTAITGVTDTDELDYIINQGAREPHRATVTIDVAVPFDDVITFTALDKGIDEVAYGSDPHVRGTITVKANETGVFKCALNNSGLDRKVRYIATSKFNRAFDVSVTSVVR